MTATTTRAAQIAEVHRASINVSRKRVALAPLSAAELTSAFADVDPAPFRKTVATRTILSTGAADAMWSGIVARLNKAAPASRTPIAAGRTSPAGSATARRIDAAVDWSSIASELNREAGLKAPVRTNAR
jgi:hypothetical protein